MKLVISITSVISLLITKRIQYANCTTLTWTTECATWFMDLRLLLSNHALMMTWYPGQQAWRVIIYHVAIYKLELFKIIAHLNDVKYWIFDAEVTTAAVPTTDPEPGSYKLFVSIKMFFILHNQLSTAKITLTVFYMQMQLTRPKVEK